MNREEFKPILQYLKKQVSEISKNTVRFGTSVSKPVMTLVKQIASIEEVDSKDVLEIAALYMFVDLWDNYPEEVKGYIRLKVEDVDKLYSVGMKIKEKLCKH